MPDRTPRPPRPPRAFDRLRVSHLRLLRLLSETGSLRAAAEVLHLTQPAVTQMVRDLETAIGQPLLLRTRRGVLLNAAGELAMQRLEAGLAALDYTVASLRETPEPSLRLGLIPAAAIDLLPRALAELGRDGGRPLRLALSEATMPALIDTLTRGTIDCFVGRVDWISVARHRQAELVAEPLTQESLWLVCRPGHPLLRRRRRDIADLLAYGWIMPPETGFTRHVLDAAFHAAGLTPPTPTIESGSIHTSLSLAGASDLLAVAPLAAVCRYERLGLVRRLKAARLDFVAGALEFVCLRSNLSLDGIQRLRQALLRAARAAAAARPLPQPK
ncbi:MAG: LysR substrate-binding domain-containing protein [Burkholderiaceae bacterium]